MPKVIYAKLIVKLKSSRNAWDIIVELLGMSLLLVWLCSVWHSANIRGFWENILSTRTHTWQSFCLSPPLSVYFEWQLPNIKDKQLLPQLIGGMRELGGKSASKLLSFSASALLCSALSEMSAVNLILTYGHLLHTIENYLRLTVQGAARLNARPWPICRLFPFNPNPSSPCSTLRSIATAHTIKYCEKLRGQHKISLNSKADNETMPNPSGLRWMNEWMNEWVQEWTTE